MLKIGRGCSSFLPWTQDLPFCNCPHRLFRFQRFSQLPSTWKSAVLRYNEYGDPEKVVKLETEEVGTELKGKDVALKIIASTINPANINTIQGIYATKPKLPAVGGSEAVAQVVALGSNVKNLRIGDRVLPSGKNGTWREYMTLSESEVIKVPADISHLTAATITVNPCTALRMLSDFVSLGGGDVIVQNGANSAVGQAVIQIAAARGWRTVNIIRDRPNKADTVQFLADMGATHVITDSDFKRPEILQALPRAKLGLNCVGGKSVADMLKLMDDRSTLVTYGGMSKQPMIVPTAQFIFRDVILCGFWMTRWVNEHDTAERQAMLDELFDLVRAGKLNPPAVEAVPLQHFEKALKGSQEGFTGKKYVFVMDEELLSELRSQK